MATYYHGGSEIPAEGLQTLYLMNPGYVGYPDGAAAAAANMVFLNPAGNPLNSGSLPHQQNPHLVGIPLQPAPVWQDPNRQPAPPDISAVHGFISRLHWASLDPSAAGNDRGGSSHHPIPPPPEMTAQMGVRRAPPVQQGLSLSLSPRYGGYRSEPDIPAPAISPRSGEDVRISGSTSSNSGISNGISGIQSVLMGSKYLKAAQQLLDEVVNVGTKGLKDETTKTNKAQMKGRKEPAAENSGGETCGRRGVELTTAERQELQMKKAKLVSMLDEVEQRYRQYHQQMQVVASSFEAAAGLGSARTYTALALQTISKQFRCLRDAIAAQIRAARRGLGEEDAAAGGKGEGSRLRFVDQQLRQQRTLQQLGMMQHNAWRPQRGLPERSVSVLRAWLFEHFLHPYPKDSDKVMLAKQTGLTRSQVSNWFINARVRLWKPMVEDMYVEETKAQQQGGSDDKASKSSDVNEDSTCTAPSHDLVQENPKKPRSRDDAGPKPEARQELCEERPTRTGYTLLGTGGGGGGGFGVYQMGDVGRFDPEQFAPRFGSGNGVSLTLSLPLSGAPPAYLSGEMAGEGGDFCSSINTPSSAHSSNAYETLSMQSRKRFAAPLLPDFVA